MRTSEILTQYVQSVLFIGLGIRAVRGWTAHRARREGILALATGLFGTSQLISAVTKTLYDVSKGETSPRWVAILSGVVVFLAVYGFLLFLAEFVSFPGWLHGIALIVTLVNIVLVFIVRQDRIFDPRRGVVLIEGVENPIPYLIYLQYAIGYLAVAFGALWVAFVFYGFRLSGVARFRMLATGGGFLLLFVAIGFFPRVFFGKPSSQTITTTLTAVRYLALASAPLLFVGFTPPRWITRRFRGGPTATPS